MSARAKVGCVVDLALTLTRTLTRTRTRTRTNVGCVVDRALTLTRTRTRTRTKVGWSTFSHTAVDVPLFSYGPGSDRFRGSMDNAEIGVCRECVSVLSVPSVLSVLP